VQLAKTGDSPILRPLLALAVASACSFVFLELVGAVLEGRVAPLDVTISQAVHAWASPAADAAMRFFTQVGSYFVVCCVVACAAAWAASKKASALALELAAVTAAAIGLNAVLKNTFERPRPDLFPEAVLPETWSFPSGHSMVSLAAYGTAALVIARLQPRYRVAAWAAVAVVVPLVGLSRVYWGVHWPSDVAAGYAAAAVLLIATRATVNRWRRSR
jgi:membrane-associated phospholipid phosphatase